MLRRFLVLALTLLVALPLCADDATVPVAATAHVVLKKKKKKKKTDPDAGSRYKSYKVLTPPAGHSYFFDANGNPITADGVKTKPAKKKRASSPDDAKPDCSQSDSCSEMPSGG